MPIKIFFTLLLTLFLCSCESKQKDEKWSSFIYPDKQNEKRSIKSSKTFNSLQECKKESIDQIKTNHIEKMAFFKCGLNCKWYDSMQMEICENMFSSKKN